MFNKLYVEFGNIQDMQLVMSSIDEILNYTNKDGLSAGILEAVVDILQAEIAKEKANVVPVK